MNAAGNSVTCVSCMWTFSYIAKPYPTQTPPPLPKQSLCRLLCRAVRKRTGPLFAYGVRGSFESFARLKAQTAAQQYFKEKAMKNIRSTPTTKTAPCIFGLFCGRKGKGWVFYMKSTTSIIKQQLFWSVLKAAITAPITHTWTVAKESDSVD